MADQDSAQERTEKATPKRLLDARRKGDVPRSRELTTAVMLAVALSAMALLGPILTSRYMQFASERWTIERRALFDDGAIPSAMLDTIAWVVTLLLPWFAAMLIAVFVGPLMMGGWTFSLNGLRPKLDKLNPLKGLKRVFGIQGLGELLKALVKFLLLGLVAVLVLKAHVNDYIHLGKLPLGDAVSGAFHIVFTMLLALIGVVVLTAVIDVPWQKWQFARKMRMTRQDIKEENKETTGNPEIKAKVRSLQQAVSQRRMLLDVPKANVIIVNPTHYAVALRYDESLTAPEVLAKGVDHMALRIRQIGNSADIPVFSAPVLARALYYHGEIGRSIPTDLYVAVAKVLAYVFQVQKSVFGEPRPQPPDSLEIPAYMRERWSGKRG